MNKLMINIYCKRKDISSSLLCCLHDLLHCANKIKRRGNSSISPWLKMKIQQNSKETKHCVMKLLLDLSGIYDIDYKYSSCLSMLNHKIDYFCGDYFSISDSK